MRNKLLPTNKFSKRRNREKYLKRVVDRNLKAVMPHDIKNHLNKETFQGTMRQTNLNTMGTFAINIPSIKKTR